MPLKPRPRLKGIPIGSYQEIKDEAGKVKIKPKRKARMSVSDKIRQRKSKRQKVVRRTAG